MHKLWKQKPHRNWRERCGKRNNRWKFIDSDNMHAFFCFVLWMKLAWRILRMRKIEFFFSLLFRRWLVAGERDRSRVTDYLDSNWWRRFSISYHLIAYSNRHTNSPPSQINHQLYHFSSSIPNLKWNRNSKSDRWGAYVCVCVLCVWKICYAATPFAFHLDWLERVENSSILLLKHVPNETCTCINQCRFCFYFFCAHYFFPSYCFVRMKESVSFSRHALTLMVASVGWATRHFLLHFIPFWILLLF